MKKALLFIALFLCLDRFMDYRINKARYHARIALLKKKKNKTASAHKTLSAQSSPQTRKFSSAQVRKNNTATS
jgi:hypothetical protein